MAAITPDIPVENASRKPLVMISRSAGLVIGLILVAVAGLLSLRFGVPSGLHA